MAIIGMDIHRAFAEAVAMEGKTCRRLGRIELRRDRLAAFAQLLGDRSALVLGALGCIDHAWNCSDSVHELRLAV